MILPQPITDGGIVVIALYALTQTVKFAGDVVKKLKTNGNGKTNGKSARCVDSLAMTTMHHNSIHNREVLDTLITKMDEQIKESVKQTTLLKIIARNGKGHLIDL